MAFESLRVLKSTALLLTLVLAGVSPARSQAPQPSTCKPGDFPVTCPTSNDYNQATGQFDLAKEIGLPGRVARIHYSVLAPGGVIGQHPHRNRPCFEYMLDGEATETKQDENGKVSVRVVKTDEVELEPSGVTHWWKNEGTKTARMIAVDIFESANASFCNCGLGSRATEFKPPANPANVKVEALGEIDLASEYPAITAMKGYVMRSRRITLLPGQATPVQNSSGQPSYTYVVEGSPVENRSDREPAPLRPEEFTFTQGNTSFYWENPTAEKVVLWVVDFAKTTLVN